jgi:hypothetical protein
MLTRREVALDFLIAKGRVISHHNLEGVGIDGQFRKWTDVFAELSQDPAWNACIDELKERMELDEEPESLNG